MEPFYIDEGARGSRQSRSRTNSHISAAANQFQDLNIQTTAASLPLEQRAPLSARAISSAAPSSYNFSDPDPPSETSPPDSATYITSPAPQSFSPFPLLSQRDLEVDWSFLATSDDQPIGTPLLRLDSAPAIFEDRTFNLSPSDQPESSQANMSTLGIQNYDARFDLGTRQSYTWPQFEISHEYVRQDLTGMASGSLAPMDDPRLIPIYARSLSSSPPRGTLTPEQRELKRQRDHARRDSKSRLRRDRSPSNPYAISNHTTPDLVPKTLSEFSNGLAPPPIMSPSPILSQTSPAPTSAYVSQYSPQLSGTGPADIYGPVYAVTPNDFVPTYPISYTSAGHDQTLQTFAPRPHSLSSASDQPNVYHNNSASLTGSPEPGDHVRVVHSRPKPQCWEHGCNGRQFSTFSNLLRHQRERSGVAAKSVCPNCGAEFTRTTARNGHMAHEKCKPRRNS
ncbi:hypothetical protein B7463_g6650, partial [Scytalidium lignicola]